MVAVLVVAAAAAAAVVVAVVVVVVVVVTEMEIIQSKVDRLGSRGCSNEVLVKGRARRRRGKWRQRRGEGR